MKLGPGQCMSFDFLKCTTLVKGKRENDQKIKLNIFKLKLIHFDPPSIGLMPCF